MLRLQRNLYSVLHNLCHFKASLNEPRINIVSSFLFFLLGVIPYLFSIFLYFSTSVRKGYNALRAASVSLEVVNTAYSLCVLLTIFVVDSCINLSFRWPCIVINSYNKNQSDALISQIYFLE